MHTEKNISTDGKVIFLTHAKHGLKPTEIRKLTGRHRKTIACYQNVIEHERGARTTPIF